MLPLSSRRSSTLLMSNCAYLASRTPSATFSKSQKSARFRVSGCTAIFKSPLLVDVRDNPAAHAGCRSPYRKKKEPAFAGSREDNYALRQYRLAIVVVALVIV